MVEKIGAAQAASEGVEVLRCAQDDTPKNTRSKTWKQEDKPDNSHSKPEQRQSEQKRSNCVVNDTFTYINVSIAAGLGSGWECVTHTVLKAWVGLLVDVRNELTVGIVADVGSPVMGDAGKADASEEKNSENDNGGDGLKSAASPTLGNGGGGARGEARTARHFGWSTRRRTPDRRCTRRNALG